MSNEQTSAQAPSAMGDLPENSGYSPFSDTEVKCDVCGMNIVREREQMAKHREFHCHARGSSDLRQNRPPRRQAGAEIAMQHSCKPDQVLACE